METNTSPCRRRLPSRGGASAGPRCPVARGPGMFCPGWPRSRRCDAGCRGARRRSPPGSRCPLQGSRLPGCGFAGVRFCRLGMLFCLGYLDSIELFDGLALHDDLGVGLPDLGGGDTAREAVKFAGVVEDVFEGVTACGVSHPHPRYQLGGVADKPSVEEVLARTSLACDGAVVQGGVFGDAFRDVTHHDLRHLVGYVFGYDLLTLGMLGRHVEHLLIRPALIAYDLRDRGRFDPASVVRDRSVGGGHIQGGDLVGAENDGRLGMLGQAATYPASPGDLRDLLRTVFQSPAIGVHRQVGEDRVIRVPERLFQADPTPLDAVVVLYLPRLRFVETDVDFVLLFFRDVCGVGIYAPLQGRDQGERLERTAWLSPALGDEVELGVLGSVADHGLYAARLGFYGDEGEVGVVLVREISLVPIGDLVGGELVLQLDGGVDAEAAVENGTHAVALYELVVGVLGEVAGEGGPGEPRTGRYVGRPRLGHRLFQGLVVVLARDVARVEHLFQHEIPLILRPLAVLP